MGFRLGLVALFGPFVGLHGLAHLARGERRRGLLRLGIGLAMVALGVAFYGGRFGNPFILFLSAPPLFLAMLVGLAATYLFLWVEGCRFALRQPDRSTNG